MSLILVLLVDANPGLVKLTALTFRTFDERPA